MILLFVGGVLEKSWSIAHTTASAITAEATEDLTLQPHVSSTSPNLQMENTEHRGGKDD